MQAGSIGWFVGMAVLGLVAGASLKYFLDQSSANSSGLGTALSLIQA